MKTFGGKCCIIDSKRKSVIPCNEAFRKALSFERSFYMKFKKRKILAAIAACTLMAGTIPVCINVYGTSPAAISAESEDTEMKRLLTLVKSRVTIPEELSEFTFSKEGKGAAIYYSFHWGTKDGVYPAKTLDIAASGESIISYNYYSSDRKYSGEPAFGAMTEAQLTEKAAAFIKMLNPNFGDSFKLDDFNATLRGRNASFSIVRTEQGRNAFLNSGSVALNKDTGEPVSFEMTWWDKASFSDISKAVSLEDMKKFYKAGTTPELVYTVNYNEDKKAYLPALIYLIKSDKYYDLLTGSESKYASDLKAQNDKNNVISEYFGGVYTTECDDAVALESPAADKGEGGVTFTPEELKAMEEENGLISKKKAEEIVRADKLLPVANAPEGVTMTMRNARLVKNDERSLRSGYTWIMSFSSKYSDGTEATAYINLDAKTGEILSLSSWDGNFKPVTDTKAAAATADAALKHLMGDKAAEYKLYNTNEWGNEKSKRVTYTYARYVNGVRVATDDVTISVDGRGVTEFFSNYHDVKFPSAEAVGSEKAFDGLFAANDINSGFMGFRTMDGKAHTYPVFYLTGNYYVNAKTGVQCRYDGTALDIKDAGYSDISDHWCKKYAEKLLEYNIYIDSDDGKLLPNNAISRKDLEELISRVFGDVTPYRTAADSETASKAPVTYRDAVKMYVEYAGGDDFAQYKGIYKSPFTDVPESDPDVGYFALAYGAGFAVPNKDGGIDPDSLVSRGMILYMLYNSLK